MAAPISSDSPHAGSSSSQLNAAELIAQPGRRRVAVVGSGVAGLVAAYAIAPRAELTLYEADHRLGGHADTHDVFEGAKRLGIDTGFIVHNRRTYPTLLRIFDELDVPTQPSEMSMSIVDEPTGIEWAGARGLRGVLPNVARLRDRRHLRMLAEIPRFHRAARALLERDTDPTTAELTTMDQFIAENRFSARLRTHFIEPLIAAVWSCDPDVAGRYPAAYLFQFLAHHGMLSVSGSPTWRTVSGGSRTYVDKIATSLTEHGATIRLDAGVTEIRRTPTGAFQITDAQGHSQLFDDVVVATHSQQALAMLAEPTQAQRDVLGAIGYSANTTVLHTDTRLMPDSAPTWSSWNFRRRRGQTGHVTVTYDLTRLQRLDTKKRYLVTLGGSDLIDPDSVIAEMDYEHPLYTPESVAAQRRLPEIDQPGLVFAGAYHGWGFHEDGALSGINAATRLGFDWDVAVPSYGVGVAEGGRSQAMASPS